jgi:hypothetical protein
MYQLCRGRFTRIEIYQLYQNLDLPALPGKIYRNIDVPALSGEIY